MSSPDTLRKRKEMEEAKKHLEEIDRQLGMLLTRDCAFYSHHVTNFFMFFF